MEATTDRGGGERQNGGRWRQWSLGKQRASIGFPASSNLGRSDAVPALQPVASPQLADCLEREILTTPPHCWEADTSAGLCGHERSVHTSPAKGKIKGADSERLSHWVFYRSCHHPHSLVAASPPCTAPPRSCSASLMQASKSAGGTRGERGRESQTASGRGKRE
jgi:hypothetical protein